MIFLSKNVKSDQKECYNHDWRCEGKQYEIGKHDGKLEIYLCKIYRCEKCGKEKKFKALLDRGKLYGY